MKETYQSTLHFETKPKNPFEEVRRLIEKSDLDKAFDLIKDDGSAEALKIKSDIKTHQKDYESAVGYLDDALAIEEDGDILKRKADVLYRWAKVTYFPEANFDKALKIINQALEISDDSEESLEYWFLKGEIYQSQERHIDARRCFLKAEQRLDELQKLEDELDLFEAHRNDTLINITGVNFYRGIDVFKPGVTLNLLKDTENEHDPDAVACLLDGEIVGYVANSEYTLINGVKSATDIRRMLNDDSVAEVLFLFQNEFVIARLKN